jgi:hypothetical protein
MNTPDSRAHASAGTRLLIAAILRRALDDLQLGGRFRTQAMAWLHEAGMEQPPGSFEWRCAALGLSASAVRDRYADRGRWYRRADRRRIQPPPPAASEECRSSPLVGAIRESPHAAVLIRRAVSGGSRTAPFMSATVKPGRELGGEVPTSGRAERGAAGCGPLTRPAGGGERPTEDVALHPLVGTSAELGVPHRRGSPGAG